VAALGPRLSRETLLDRYSQHTRDCATCSAALEGTRTTIRRLNTAQVRGAV
jgi:hypothetical protein